MEKLALTLITRHDNLSKDDFVHHYLRPAQPVIMRSFAAGWNERKLNQTPCWSMWSPCKRWLSLPKDEIKNKYSSL